LISQKRFYIIFSTPRILTGNFNKLSQLNKKCGIPNYGGFGGTYVKMYLTSLGKDSIANTKAREKPKPGLLVL
jgi:hypothetical protein